jgi:hypothetical protein
MKTVDKFLKVRLSDIQPSEQNKSLYDGAHEDRVRKLANDIKRNGLQEPLIITTDNIILSGHTRYRALQHLGRTFVEVRRAQLHSGDPQFTDLLVSCNNQREKTEREKLAEISATIDPIKYIKRREAEINKDIDLEKVDGELKSSRTMTGNYKHLADAVMKIMKENKDYLPMPLRGIFYQLLNDPPIESIHSGRRFSNCLRSYQLLSKVTTRMRVNGILPYEWIRDDKRKFNVGRGFQNKEIFIRQEMRTLFTGYHRDLLQTQDHYFTLVCEKETLSTPINRVARKYGVPTLYMQGNSSITVRHKIMQDREENGSKPMIVLVLSDLDPSGLKIQDSLIGSIKKDFKTDVRGFRVGVKKDDIKEFNLHSDQTAKKSDTSFKKFVKKTGLKKAYELEALPMDILTSQVDEAIKTVIDLDRFNKEQQKFNNEVQKLETLRERAIEALSFEF